jgi:hypothetical protein
VRQARTEDGFAGWTEPAAVRQSAFVLLCSVAAARSIKLNRAQKTRVLNRATFARNEI